MVEKMERYQRVEKPKTDTLIDENEIRITSQRRMRNYITYAMSLLHVFLSLSLSMFFYLFIFCMVVLIFVSFGYAIIYQSFLDCFVVCIFFLILLLWLACKRVWLGFWWCACVLWSPKFEKIADNYFSIIDVRLLKQKKGRKSYSRKLKCNTSFNLFKNMFP